MLFKYKMHGCLVVCEEIHTKKTVVGHWRLLQSSAVCGAHRDTARIAQRCTCNQAVRSCTAACAGRDMLLLGAFLTLASTCLDTTTAYVQSWLCTSCACTVRVGAYY
jgi:hypothetical protein